jgi:hypothetical protein
VEGLEKYYTNQLLDSYAAKESVRLMVASLATSTLNNYVRFAN